MDKLREDIYFALRGAFSKPLFSILLVAVLALGIGATSAMFAVVKGGLIDAPPFAEPDRVMALYAPQPEVKRAPLSAPDFIDWQKEATSFDAMALLGFQNANVLIGEEPQRLLGLRVSGGYFDVVGLRAAHGRLLDDEDDRLERPVVVLSYATFRDRFGEDPNVVGSSIDLDGRPFEVVGVLHPDDRFVCIARFVGDIAVPLGLTAPNTSPLMGERGNHSFFPLARLRPGVPPEAAETELGAIAGRLAEAYPKTNAKVSARVIPLSEVIVGEAREQLLLLLAAIAFLLLLACANAANLLLVRGAGRRGELALRAALGATRGRLVRQLVTESVVLALVGATAGVLLALWLVDVLVLVLRESLPVTAEIALDPWTVGFTALAGLTSGVVAGTAPALASSRIDTSEALKAGAARATTDSGGRRLRGTLVVAEVAIAVGLLAGAGLLLTSFAKLKDVSLGIAVDGVHTAGISLPKMRYPEKPDMARFAAEVARRLRENPEVTDAAVLSRLPMGTFNTNGSVIIEGRPRDLPGEAPLVERHRVGPSSFATLGVRLLRGRDFGSQDTTDAPAVMIVNQAFVDRFFPGESGLGQMVRWDTDRLPLAEIVGVIDDVRSNGPAQPARLESYLPFEQAPGPRFSFAVKTNNPNGAELIRRAVASVDPTTPLFDLRTMEEITHDNLRDRTSTMYLLGAFALAAMLLAALGVFGVVSHQTTQRTREMGIRLALGAAPRDVVMLIVRQAMRIVGIGVAAGLVVALVGARMMEEFLFATSAFDLWVHLTVISGVAFVGLVASWLPARRAAGIAPASALRYE